MESSGRTIKVIKKKTKNSNQGDTPLADLAPVFFLLSAGFLLLLAYSWAPEVYAHVTRIRSHPIQVWDHVLSEETCQILHQACQPWEERDNVLFQFPSKQHLNPIEQVIHDILIQIHPEGKYYVEYWVRQKWHHTLAHADMDEGLLKQDQPIRYPVAGHVLYLQRGSTVNGPTVVFPNATNGGQLVRRDNRDVEMLLVPNINGRLLRFEGHLLHAVPRPADLWLHPVVENLIHDPESMYGRSVLLFNLWPMDEPPPMGREFTPEYEEQGATKVSCNDRNKWKIQKIDGQFEGTLLSRLVSSRYTFQLPLMGPERRRGTKEFTPKFKATSLVEQAFLSEDPSPRRVYLSQYDMDFQSLFNKQEL